MQTDTEMTVAMPLKTHALQRPGLQFVDAEQLLELLFPPESRPTIRWLRERQKRRDIPFIKLGRLVFFVPAQVQEALVKKQILPRW